MDDIIVFDDIVSTKNQNILEDFFTNHTKYKYGNNIEHSEDGSYFPQYVFVREKLSDYPPEINDIISDIETQISKKLNIKSIGNYRTKANKLLSTDTPTDDKRKGMHIDRWVEHYSLIYYINNSDGDTYFYRFKNFDEDMPRWMKIVQNSDFDKFDFIKSIPPKKGRIVLFDGMLPHHSDYPSKGERYVLNFNLFEKKNIL